MVYNNTSVLYKPNGAVDWKKRQKLNITFLTQKYYCGVLHFCDFLINKTVQVYCVHIRKGGRISNWYAVILGKEADYDVILPISEKDYEKVSFVFLHFLTGNACLSFKGIVSRDWGGLQKILLYRLEVLNISASGFLFILLLFLHSNFKNGCLSGASFQNSSSNDHYSSRDSNSLPDS